MRVRRVVKFAIVSVAAIAIVLLAAFGWFKLAPRRVPPGQPPLQTLHADSMPGFRNAFNGVRGEVRMLVLLSPT